MSETERVAVISGGGTGIGRSIARHLMDNGMHVVITGRRADVLADGARALRAEAEAGSVSFVRADVSIPADVEALAGSIADMFPSIDAIVSNAGGPIREATPTLEDVAAHWRRSFDQNCLTAVLLTHGLASLLRRPGGRIVLIGSLAARTGGSDAAYGAMKSTFYGWVAHMVPSFGADGITVNVVLPGFVPGTGMVPPGMTAEMVERVGAGTAMGRVGEPDDIGAVVSYLVSPAASYVTGQHIEVNGGVRRAM